MLPYKQAPSLVTADQDVALGDASVQNLKRQVAALLNAGLQAPALAPGRSVQLVLSAGDGFAQMNAFQQVSFYSQTFNYKATTLLPVLCHEIAHSAQNHIPDAINRLQSAQATAALKQVDQACGVFTAAVYRQDTGIMTWNNAAWTALSRVLTQQAPILGDWQKRQESEADIDGAMICAKMGLPIDSYILGMSQVDQAAHVPFKMKLNATGDLDVSTVRDGAQAALPLSTVEAFCAVPNHPGGQERLDQLHRLKPQLVKYYDSKATAANAFLSQFDGLALAAKQGLAAVFANKDQAPVGPKP